jgi:aldose 1-epimerase
LSPAPPATLQIAAGDARATLCPGIGGSVARFRWRGHAILRDAPQAAITGGETRMMGCYPLVPYSNRIGHARLLFEGTVHRLRANFPPEPHAIHGVGWQRPWKVERQSPAALEISLDHAPDGDWPFAFSARQSFAIRDDALHLGLTIRSEDRAAMPAGLGFHPFFPLDSETTLQSEWSGCWVPGPEKLPVAWVPTPPEADYRSARGASGWSVDRCFTGWGRRARLDYGTHGVEITATQALPCIVCFAPGEGGGFIALEPVSHVIDAFSLAARGHPDTGMRRLLPGESFQAGMTIRPLDAGSR